MDVIYHRYQNEATTADADKFPVAEAYKSVASEAAEICFESLKLSYRSKIAKQAFCPGLLLYRSLN